MTFNKALIALAMVAMLSAQYADAKGSRSSSSRSSSSSSRSSSYSRPSTPRYTTTPARAPNGRPATQSSKPTVVHRATVINRTVYKSTYRPTRVTSNYNSLSYYHPQPRPSHFQSNTGWYAFAALAAYMILSDDEKATQPGPDTAPLKEVPMKDISTQLWADGKFDATDLALYKEWQRVNGK